MPRGRKRAGSQCPPPSLGVREREHERERVQAGEGECVGREDAGGPWLVALERLWREGMAACEARRRAGRPV